MKQNLLVLAVVTLVVAAMLWAGAKKSREGRAAGQQQNLSAADMKGKPAPDFELKKFDGGQLRLSDYKGKAVLINFWATWCGPCKIEMPWFVDLHDKYAAQGFEILGVAMDDSKDSDIIGFAKDMKVNYPVVRGKEAIGDLYGGVPGLPTSVFIGRDGRIVDVIPGLVSRSDLEDDIRSALKQGTADPSQSVIGIATGAPATEKKTESSPAKNDASPGARAAAAASSPAQNKVQ